MAVNDLSLECYLLPHIYVSPVKSQFGREFFKFSPAFVPHVHYACHQRPTQRYMKRTEIKINQDSPKTMNCPVVDALRDLAESPVVQRLEGRKAVSIHATLGSFVTLILFITNVFSFLNPLSVSSLFSYHPETYSMPPTSSSF